MIEHAIHLFGEHLRVVQFVFIGELDERVVGHGDPERVAETRGDGVIVELSGSLDEGEEARRAQDGAVGRAKGLRHRIAACERLAGDLAIRGSLLVGHRTTEGAARKSVDQLVERGRVSRFQVGLAEQILPHRGTIRVRIDAFNVDAAVGDAFEAFLGEVTTFEGDVAALRARGRFSERGVVGFEFKPVVFLNPGLVNHVTRRAGGLDEADHVKHRCIGLALAGAQRAPDRAVGAGIDGVDVPQRDAIPAVVWHPGGRAAEELQRYRP